MARESELENITTNIESIKSSLKKHSIKAGSAAIISGGFLSFGEPGTAAASIPSTIYSAYHSLKAIGCYDKLKRLNEQKSQLQNELDREIYRHHLINPHILP